MPVLPADDIAVAKTFYTALGFSVTFEFSDPSGNTIFVIGPPRQT